MKSQLLREMMNVLNDRLAPWLHWKMGIACHHLMKAGLYIPALKSIRISTKQPLKS